VASLSADVCFEAHHGLKPDIALGPKTFTKPDSCTAAKRVVQRTKQNSVLRAEFAGENDPAI
jgi:hypothetical protein